MTVAETSCGFGAPPWNIYWERFAPPGGATRRRPLVLVHGSNQTGACWRTRVDGAPGWIDELVAAGYECWTVDWPATGRSGLAPLERVDFRFLVDGLEALLRDEIGRDVDAIGHSMGGFTVFKLREQAPGLVARVVGLAPAPPRELTPASEVLGDDGTTARVRFAYTVDFEVDRTRAYHPTDEYVERQVIGPSTRFPRHAGAALRASLQPVPPLLLLERLHAFADPGLEIQDRAAFHGARMLIVTGTADPVHPREVDGGTADFFRDLGADVTFLWLGDAGVEGNGHLLMGEDNSSEILELILEWLEPPA